MVSIVFSTHHSFGNMRLSLAISTIAAGWGAHALSLPACDITKSGQEVCDDFCNDRCGFWNASAGETGQPQTISLFRLTNANLTGVRNKDTADPRGDIGFVLARKNLTATCREDPSATGCFLGGSDIYGLFKVEFDGQWGPYLQCNPLQVGGQDPVKKPLWLDQRNFSCGMDCLSPTETGCHSPWSTGNKNTSDDGVFGPKCWCDGSHREGRAVGRAAPTFLKKGGSIPNATVPSNWVPQCQMAYKEVEAGSCLTGNVKQTLHAWSFDSAIAMGCEACTDDLECTGWSTKDNRTVQLFSGNTSLESGSCTGAVPVPGPIWKMKSWFGVGQLGGYWYSTPKAGECPEGAPLGTDGCTWREVSSSYKNATCVNDKVDAAVEVYAKTCMDGCTQPLNRTSDCYLDCYRDALMGNAAKNVTKMPEKQVINPWVQALERDDPSEGGCPQVQPLPCEGDQCDPLLIDDGAWSLVV